MMVDSLLKTEEHPRQQSQPLASAVYLCAWLNENETTVLPMHDTAAVLFALAFTDFCG